MYQLTRILTNPLNTAQFLHQSYLHEVYRTSVFNLVVHQLGTGNVDYGILEGLVEKGITHGRKARSAAHDMGMGTAAEAYLRNGMRQLEKLQLELKRGNIQGLHMLITGIPQAIPFE